MKLSSDECFWTLMISILIHVLSWTQTPITPPSPHLRPIYTLHHSQPRDVCFAASLSCNIDLLALHPDEEDHQDHYLYKLTPQTVVALSLISHGRVSISSDTSFCHHIATSCKTNHLCIVYIISDKNWHLVVLNFKFFISYRPWV